MELLERNFKAEPRWRFVVLVQLLSWLSSSASLTDSVYSVKGVMYASVGFVVKPCVYKRLGWNSL